MKSYGYRLENAKTLAANRDRAWGDGRGRAIKALQVRLETREAGHELDLGIGDMASFFSKLFGGGKPEANDDHAQARAEAVTYKEFSIAANPMRDGEQWRLCGVISKTVAGGGEGAEETQLERTFIRADLYPTREEAETFAIRKGQQIIDEQGDRLFADGAPTGRA